MDFEGERSILNGEIDRRGFLKAGATGGVAALAGCSGDEGGKSNTSRTSEPEEETENQDLEPTTTVTESQNTTSTKITGFNSIWNEAIPHPHELSSRDLIPNSVYERIRSKDEIEDEEVARETVKNLSYENIHLIDVRHLNRPEWEGEGKMFMPSISDFSFNEAGPEIFIGPFSYGISTVPESTDTESFIDYLKDQYGEPEENSGMLIFEGQFDPSGTYLSEEIQGDTFRLGVDSSGSSPIIPFVAKTGNEYNLVSDVSSAFDAQMKNVNGNLISLGKGDAFIDDDFEALYSFIQEKDADVGLCITAGDLSEPHYREPGPLVTTGRYDSEGSLKGVRGFMDSEEDYEIDPREYEVEPEELNTLLS